MSDPDRESLIGEIDARIKEVDASKGTCPGHHALQRGITTLLRCQRAQLCQRARGGFQGGLCGGGVIAGAIMALRYWLENKP